MPPGSGPRLLRRRDHPLRRPPPDGRCPIYRLPDELWLEVLSHLDWEELVAIRPTSKRIAALALSHPLHQSLTIPCLSSRYLPPVLTHHILPHVRHLYVTDSPSRSFSWLPHMHLRPTSMIDAVLDVLRALPTDTLLSLSLRCFATPARWDMIGAEIARVGGTLEHLDLHGARLDSPFWAAWMRDVGVRGKGLRVLDLGVSGITTLPLSLPFDNLEVLSLRSCYLLQSYELDRFLTHLPPRLRTLNLSYLSQLSLDALYALRVTIPGSDGRMERTPLNAVHLVGIDHLTRTDVRSLQRHWAEARATCSDLQHFGATPARDRPLRLASPIGLHPPPTPLPRLPRSSSPSSSATEIVSASTAETPSTSSADTFSTMSSTPPSPSVPITPRTPDSDASNPIMPMTPATPDSASAAAPAPTNYRIGAPGQLALAVPDRGSSIWEFGAMDKAMYTPEPLPEAAPKPAVVFPFASTLSDSLPRFRPRRARSPVSNKVRIFHSALLESDDEAGYRRFIGEVVDGTLGADWGELADADADALAGGQEQGYAQEYAQEYEASQNV